jgi:hypothetical protein
MQRFLPHSVSHWLGIDLHDCPAAASSLPFKAGMALTVEPGLYLGDSPDIPKWFLLDLSLSRVVFTEWFAVTGISGSASKMTSWSRRGSLWF